MDAARRRRKARQTRSIRTVDCMVSTALRAQHDHESTTCDTQRPCSAVVYPVHLKWPHASLLLWLWLGTGLPDMCYGSKARSPARGHSSMELA